MFPYIFALLLLSFYSSSGAPPPTLKPPEPTSNERNTANKSIPLSILANTCGNPFLAAQIKSNIPDCSALVSTTSEKQFQCMLFYDINRQLCTAVASSKLALNEDYTAKIEAAQDVSQLCKAIQGWIPTDLGEVYKKNVKFVFEDVVRCAKACSADNADILNMDSNYYCKYLKWGIDMLKSEPPTPAQTAASKEAIAQNKPVETDGKATKLEGPAPAALPASTLKDNQVAPSNPNPQPQNAAESKDKPQPAAAPDKTSSENPSSPNNAQGTVAQAVVIPSMNAETGAAGNDDKLKAVKDEEPKNTVVSGEEQVNNIPRPDVDVPGSDKKEEVVNENDKTASGEKKTPKAPGSTKKEDEVVNQLASNDVNSDPDDYQVADESRGLSDLQGDDDGDDLPLADTDQQDPDLPKTNPKRVDIPINDFSQKEYYPNADSFPEEDDHFFPFFLTAIIMVVLLYVLYHNKSKVSKVIMGLIVEGRQPGRRRNSRGHAYKRLDTLEQAMSANTAAPPSKIIY